MIFKENVSDTNFPMQQESKTKTRIILSELGKKRDFSGAIGRIYLIKRIVQRDK